MQVELPAPRKSIGVEVNYGVRFQGMTDAISFLEELSTEVESRMAIGGSRGRTVTLKLKRCVRAVLSLSYSAFVIFLLATSACSQFTPCHNIYSISQVATLRPAFALFRISCSGDSHNWQFDVIDHIRSNDFRRQVADCCSSTKRLVSIN